MDNCSTEVVYAPPLDKYSTEVVHPFQVDKYSTEGVYTPPRWKNIPRRECTTLPGG